MAMVVFSIFCLTKIIKTKLRKMRLEFRIIGSRMGGIWKPHKTLKKKVSFAETVLHQESQTST